MSKPRLVLLALAAAPALLLGACKKGADGGGGGTAVAGAAGPVAPAPAGGWAAQVARTPEGGYRMGNPDAPVKLIEYGSRTCPHCAAFGTEGLPKLRDTYVSTGKVSYEFRDYAIHAPDLAAILLGQCVAPEAFFGLLEQMFADQPAVVEKLQALPPGFEAQLQGKSANAQAALWAQQLGYIGFVGQRGVPAAKAQACLADTKAVDAFAKAQADGTQKYNITGTPSFVLNGEPQASVYDWASLEPRLKAALGQ
ncbi:DsbA family protein [Sphingomonas morindae]|uniref:DsbA family protein n=1 Tax=Sphingomonas morindae TaxID=1541170 RepID=A0ABY4X5D1_9SPHN|nr:thioredoxin domain-containing protein [Sphingomonas morindae]USI72045.1 DsbA family protein [Sphingomonas morindae]